MYKPQTTFRFPVDNFRAFSRGNKQRQSPPEFVRGLPWKILVSPEGPCNRRTLGFYLQCNADSDSKSWSCYADASLRILLPNGVSCYEQYISHVFTSDENNLGVHQFITFNELFNHRNGFINNDILILEVDIAADIASGILDKYKPEATFRFSMDDCKDFARRDEPRLSPPEYIRGLTWNILVVPEGPRERRSLGLYLQCNLETGSKCFARATLRILSQKPGKPNQEHEITGRMFASGKESGWGEGEVMLFSKLLNPKIGFIDHRGTVTFEVSVSADSPSYKEAVPVKIPLTPTAPNFQEGALKKTLTHSLNTFACKICFEIINPPAHLCSHCHQIIGCAVCVKPIMESNGASCPWCRHNWVNGGVEEVKGLDDFLANLRLHDQ